MPFDGFVKLAVVSLTEDRSEVFWSRFVSDVRMCVAVVVCANNNDDA